ncbi:Uncharacterized protein YcgM [Coccomyxa sp. Obi]|nr:Uncharacterized protein YcgM [Coccomyxa sp. Obi]
MLPAVRRTATQLSLAYKRPFASMGYTPAISGDKLICLGKNYLEHAKELGDAVPDKPVIFLKPPSAAVVASSQQSAVAVQLPRNRGSVHYEAEMLLRLDDNLEVDAVSLGLDLTLRELQTELKKKGHPWEIAKAFPQSAVIGPWIDVASFPDYIETEFSFELDGEEKQRGAASQMMCGVPEALKYIKGCFTLVPGDVIFTGTPKGVGPLKSGQTGTLRWGDKLSYEVSFQDS